MKDFLNIMKKIWLFAVLGLIFRLVLMPITLHPDIWATSFAQYLFSFKGVFNIYDYLGDLPKTSPILLNYGSNFFTYPPLAYFTLGIFGFLLRPFFNNDFFINLPVILPNVLSDQRLYWHLFLTKLPLLFFDFGTLFFLTKLFDEENERKKIALLWVFNPLTLYTTYMIGQFDIIPVFFCVFSLYLTRKKNFFLGALVLGIGGAFKMFPLFFLPFLVLNFPGSFVNKIKLALVGILPFVLTILPFLKSIYFRQYVLFSNQSEKMLFAKISVSGAEYLSLFVVFYIILLFLSLTKKTDLWKWFFSVMLLFFSVTHYHPQWFLWLTPFLFIFITKFRNYLLAPMILLVCWFIIMILFEPSLSIGLFAPISNSLVNSTPLTDILAKYYDVFQLKSIVRSIFFGISLAMIVYLQKDEKTS